jgi:predicted ester cyclase
MSVEQNKAAVRRFVDEVLSGHDLSVLESILRDDYVDHDPGNIQGEEAGIEGAKQDVTAFVTGLPDMRVTIGDLIGEGDYVTVRGVLEGTHQGELFGIPATGKPIRVSAMQMFRLDNGRIAEAWLELDRVGMLQQLGVMPG